MKKVPTKKAALPPGIVPYKGANAKITRWHREVGEPENLAHAGVGTRMRQAALKK
jgi:hypothetical protein